MADPALVSVIVVNWNGKAVIFDCLDNLLRQSYEPKEIVVVDNASHDGSLEAIQTKYAGSVQIIRNDRNLGFAEGVNIGIRASHGELIALLNSDAVADPNWLQELASAVQQSWKIGMCAGKVYLAGRDRVLDNVGLVLTRDGLGLAKGRLQKDTGQFDSDTSVLCPSGCAALYRRKMLEEIGFFDSRFFLYGEDVDAGLRGRLLGYECGFAPRAIAYHKFSASAGPASEKKAFFVERNRACLVIKCFPAGALFLSFFYSPLRYFLHVCSLIIRKGPAARCEESFAFLRLPFIVVRAWVSALWMLPYLIRSRRRLWKRAVVTPRKLNSSLCRHRASVFAAAFKELSAGE